jgi:hypothetical protein
MPAPASSNLQVLRSLGGNIAAMNRATGAGVMNCPSVDFLFWLIVGDTSRRI